MVNKRRQIWVDKVDIEFLRGDIKDLILRVNPELKGMNLTDRYLFKRCVETILELI